MYDRWKHLTRITYSFLLLGVFCRKIFHVQFSFENLDLFFFLSRFPGRIFELPGSCRTDNLQDTSISNFNIFFIVFVFSCIASFIQRQKKYCRLKKICRPELLHCTKKQPLRILDVSASLKIKFVSFRVQTTINCIVLLLLLF